MMSLAVSLHLLATLIWVGGMFFAHMALRPVAAMRLAPPQRLPLLHEVFKRFFAWVWGSIVTLWLTGAWMIAFHFGGMSRLGLHVHLMMGIALLMTALFVLIYFFPYRRMRHALAVDDFKEAGRALALIRSVVFTNLLLGLLVSVLGAGGRYWSI